MRNMTQQPSVGKQIVFLKKEKFELNNDNEIILMILLLWISHMRIDTITSASQND